MVASDTQIMAEITNAQLLKEIQKLGRKVKKLDEKIDDVAAGVRALNADMNEIRGRSRDGGQPRVNGPVTERDEAENRAPCRRAVPSHVRGCRGRKRDGTRAPMIRTD